MLDFEITNAGKVRYPNAVNMCHVVKGARAGKEGRQGGIAIICNHDWAAADDARAHSRARR